MRLTALGSGSAGNATLLEDGPCRVLIDAGLSYREVTRRLEAVGVAADDIGAVVITHAHGDHTRGAALFSRRHGAPVHTTAETRAVWGQVEVSGWGELRCDEESEICGFRFTPFEVLHDAEAETVAFRIETPDGAIGFATDIGTVTLPLQRRFADCRVLVMESNHAVELLRVSPYASSTRARIGGDRGHLSNESLGAYLRQHLGDGVRCVVLAHLSRVNNLPELAEMSCREALRARGRDDVRVVVTRQDRVAETVDLGAWAAPALERLAAGRQAALPF